MWDEVYTEVENDTFHSINIGGHHIQIWEEDGIPRINVRDHAQIAIEGDHKDNPLVVVGNGEFPTRIRRLSEVAFWERYNGDGDDPEGEQ